MLRHGPGYSVGLHHCCSFGPCDWLAEFCCRGGGGYGCGTWVVQVLVAKAFAVVFAEFSFAGGDLCGLACKPHSSGYLTYSAAVPGVFHDGVVERGRRWECRSCLEHQQCRRGGGVEEMVVPFCSLFVIRQMCPSAIHTSSVLKHFTACSATIRTPLSPAR